jgi:transcriptional regulator with XRE-family HTH domain
MQNSHRTINQLRRARQRLGLKQKQVASLLQLDTQAISRYENAKSMPSLQTAMRLEIICGVPLRGLFPQVYEKLRADIRTSIEADRTLAAHLLPVIQELCPYEQQLAWSQAEETLYKVRDHITQLAKTLAPLWPSK